MSKIGLIAGSTTCLDYIDHNHDIKMIRFQLEIDGKNYVDFAEITADEFYNKLVNDEKLVPRSSMPSLGDINEQIEICEKEGCEDVIITTISSQLSSYYQVAKMAQDEYDGNMNIHIIDTKNAAISEGYINLLAAKYRDEGKSVEEIIEMIEKISTNRRQFFLVDSLRLLVANGRLSGVSGMIGSLLKIKPLLKVDNEGKIVTHEKIRTTKKAMNRMMEIVFEEMDTKGLTNNEDFVITYNTSNDLNKFDYIKEMIDKKFPGCTQYPAPITPVIGCHTGPGVVGIAYFDLRSIK